MAELTPAVATYATTGSGCTQGVTRRSRRAPRPLSFTIGFTTRSGKTTTLPTKEVIC